MRKIAYHELLLLPNKLTLLRIIGTPFLIFLLSVASSQKVFAIFNLFLFLMLWALDILDGHIARKRKLVTDIGKLLDPMADKLLLLPVLFILLRRFHQPLLFWCIPLFAIEFLLLIGAGIAFFFPKFSVIKLGANWFGKMKAGIEMKLDLALFLCYFGIVIPTPLVLLTLLGATFFAFCSLWGHLRGAKALLF